MSIDDNKCSRILRASDLELSEVAFELDVSKGEKELGMVVIEDLVRDTGSIDTTKDLNIGTAIRRANVRCRQVRVADTGGKLLGHRNDFVLVATLDSSS